MRKQRYSPDCSVHIEYSCADPTIYRSKAAGVGKRCRDLIHMIINFFSLYKKADSITLPAFCLLDYGLSWKSPSGLSCFSSRLGSFLLSPPLVVITSSLSKRIKYSDQTKSSLHSRYPCQKQCHNRRSGAGDFLWQ